MHLLPSRLRWGEICTYSFRSGARRCQCLEKDFLQFFEVRRDEFSARVGIITTNLFQNSVGFSLLRDICALIREERY